MHAPSTAAVARATSRVIERATFAAVELGNFPLQATDVHCAFDNWLLDEQGQSPSSTRLDYFEALAAEVRKTLAKFGFTF